MAFRTWVRPSFVAVTEALSGFGGRVVPSRLMGVEVFFPDVGSPVVERVGFLRYPGEAVQGDAEPVAPGPTSDHSIDRSNEHGWEKA